jgi:hypothetical protein
MKKDLNYIAGLEKAIKKKYGNEAIINPLSRWSDEKEEDYQQQLQNSYPEQSLDEAFEDLNGVLIHKKLIKERKRKHCCTCSSKIKNLDDDACYTKYQTCFACYIEHIEGREERWLKGWRPNNVRENTTNNSGPGSSGR